MLSKFSRLTAGVALALSSALVLVGCSGTGVVAPSEGTGSVPAEYAPFYTQQLSWTNCGEALQCATAKAPVDWAKPTGATMSLALIRHVATSSDRLGSLFVNPGGPGGSGVAFVRDSLNYAVDKKVQANYDVIGFDPRGVGASTPVTCVSSASEMDQWIYGLNSQPRFSPAWLAEREADSQAYAAGCAQKTGDLLFHVDTVSAAKDLDMLRAAVGDSVFNYLGYSYGTLLGATYADLFPTRVGRMVLDGALDPASTGSEVLETQAVGFENALTSYLRWCFQQKQCPFTASGAGHPGTAATEAELSSARSRISQLLAALDKTPLTGTDGRKVGADTMVTAIITPLYSSTQWPALTSIFNAVAAGKADAALASADSYNNRVNGKYLDNSSEAFTAVNCLDYPVSTSPSTWTATATALEKASPVFGSYLAYGEVLCNAWPAKSTRVPAPVKAVGSPDILVVGTTGDPATPYQWAVNLAKELPNGHLLTYVGEGHTAYNKGSMCVNDAVDAFLLSGKVPAGDARCS